MKISIVVPVYNVAEVMRRCVESVLPQMSDGAELILVDDGSTDGSARICDEYAEAPGVSVIHKPNGGLSSARNAGIDAAKGDYLLFLDGDDYLRPGSIRLLAELARRSGKFDFIQFRYDEVTDYSDRRAAGPVSGLSEVTDRRRMFELKFQLGGIGASACTKLIARDVFDTLRFKEGIIHEDEEFTGRMINRANRAIYISNQLYMYVQRSGSIITSRFSPKRLDIIPVLESQIEILSGNGYDDLALLVRNKLFTALTLMYVDARRANMKESVRTITRTARAILPSVQPAGGTVRLIARGMRLHLPMLQSYYLYKVIFDSQDTKTQTDQ